jgi:hypothetical protein
MSQDPAPWIVFFHKEIDSLQTGFADLSPYAIDKYIESTD